MKYIAMPSKMTFVYAILALSFSFFDCKKGDDPVPPTKPPVQQPVDPPVYAAPYQGIPDTKDVVMYEVNLRGFSAEGNFKGVQNRLDQIKDLGVNVIWLMPINPVGQLKSAGGLGSPYAVKNYKEVNPEFGTLEDFRTLVKEAHNRNMAVVIDWVANHTAWDNPWIANKNWYKQDASGNIIPPPNTNWTDVAALDYNNQDMRKEMIRSMKYWVLATNIDGFRCDAADLMPYDFWKQAIDTLKKFDNRKLVLLAEGSRANHFNAGFQLNYGWDYYKTLKDVFKGTQADATLFTTNAQELTNIPEGFTKLRFTTNHDETAWDDTPMGLFSGKKGSMAAFVLASYMGGSTLLYNGQEVGSTKKLSFFEHDPIDWTTNPDMVVEYKKLIAFKNGSDAVKRGSIETIADPSIVVFKRIYNGKEVLVIVNANNSAVTYNVPTSVSSASWSNVMKNEDMALGATLTLQPYDYYILSKK
ncbi:alpha-amylase family glycosyl hydrolase [Solitalea sp. MAHUQ-68]|uniref:Alpha-amylase family glycosyl hydrolase n=1 Tax=Solitalea agri TaxID=2953739 RepID=A0A9X2JDJ0_9SPHI|nr:alpha-amylase family glycosyl hydrolase [Solitalea agri]MCO4291446.1 alpha-amylase family glycosyl hydrolase [Solitalea agri]